MKATTKSPIKDKPLRLPGQSLEEARRKLIEDRLELPFILAVFFLVLTGMEWWRYYTDLPPSPVLYSLLAAFAMLFLAWRIIKVLPESRAFKQGIEGEKVVGQFLEHLREKGYHVFHDLTGDGFNVDHVIIGPGGVYTIETKTWSKPVRGEPRIRFDGNQLHVDGKNPERDPIVQARAQASWLRGILVESTGRPLEVFPVVVFPGWYIEQTKDSLRNIWVLEPKALPKFLDNEPQRLDPDEVRLASFHLSRFIRSCERERT